MSRGRCRFRALGRAAVTRVTAQSADGGLQVALGVDQEVGGDDDLLAFAHALDHLDEVLAAPAELDFARLEAPFGELHEHDAARSGVDHGRVGYGEHRPFAPTEKSTCAYIAGFRSWPGLASSTRTATVRVSAFSVG